MFPSEPRHVDRFWNNVTKSGAMPDSSCWNWTGGKVHNGYGTFRIGRKWNIRAHRYAWFLSNGDIPDGLLVLHSCDNRACVRPEHLFLGTAKDNTVDMIRKARNVNPPLHLGERMWKTRLTEQQVREIRALREMGFGPTAIARNYGVTKGAITSILAGRCWKHVA